MRVGITFDLRSEYLAEGYDEQETAEFDRADTIDAIADALQQLGHVVDRIGRAKTLVRRLAAGDAWDLVFNICEGLRGMGREAQVPAILETFEIPYTFADPLVMSVCLQKELTKLIVAQAGLPTPAARVVRQLSDCETVALPFPLFAKPLAEGTGKGISPASRLANAHELRAVCEQLLQQYRQPVLVESYLPGREFTVGLLGSGSRARVLGTLEIVLLPGAEAGVYSYVNKERCEELVEYRLVEAARDPVVRVAEDVALRAWQALDCRDGGRIDLRCDAGGKPQFLEANPLAGLHPFHSDLPMLSTAIGMPYRDLIGAIVNSANERVKPR